MTIKLLLIDNYAIFIFIKKWFLRSYEYAHALRSSSTARPLCTVLVVESYDFVSL